MKSTTIVAYALDENRGSEPEAGWLFTSAWAANGHRINVITREKNQAFIQRAVPGARTYGMELSKTLLWLKKRLPYGDQIYAYFWHLAARKLIFKSPTLRSADFFHHITFGADWMPCAIPRRFSRQTFWGPVGGYSKLSLLLLKFLGLRGSIDALSRLAFTNLLRLLSRAANATDYKMVFANNPTSANMLEKLGYRNVEVQHHAFSNWRATNSQRIKEAAPRRLLGVGRLIPWKGWKIAILAMLYLPESYELELLGRGKDLRRLERIIARHSLSNRVRISGFVTRDKLREKLETSDILVHPSLHDSSPFAVAEAISLGKPVVALDLCGSAHLLRMAGMNPVEPKSEDLVREFAERVVRAEHPTNRQFVDSRGVRAVVSNWIS